MNTRFESTRFVAFFAIAAAVGSAIACADERPVTTLSHTSLYQAQPIAGKAHRIQVTGTIQNRRGKGNIRFDSNECHLNAFGDVHISTAVGYYGWNVEFTRIEADDPLQRDREVYEVTSGIPKDLRMRLVVDPKTSPSMCRLIVVEDNKATAVTLISHEYSKDAKPVAEAANLKSKAEQLAPLTETNQGTIEEK